MNPWSRARSAERRAAIAEDRAAFLEQELAWMRQQVESSRMAETTALKIAANVAYQQAFGFVPFSEVASVPPREETIRERADMLDMPHARDRAIESFKKAELENFVKLHAE